MAEKEGFEPSIPFWGIHDFQSCALGQLRDFSMKMTLHGQLAYITPYVQFCQVLFSMSLDNFVFSVDNNEKSRYNILACRLLCYCGSVGRAADS